MTVIQYVLGFFILWIITVFLQYIFKITGKKPAGYCPLPSPPTLPLIGHLHLLTPVAYKGFHALNNKYGPILYLRLLTYPAVLVSSAPVATEIFRAQDVHFASRIKSPFEDNLLFGSSTSFFNAPYGDYWKFMKKICMTELLGTSQMKKLKNVRREEVVRFLSKMLEIGQKNEVADLSAEVLTVANNGTCRMIMSARCSGEDNQAEKCRGLVSESFDLAAKLAVCNLFGPLKRIGIWYLRKKIADVPKRYDELFENVLLEHEEKAKREGPNIENKDLMDILLEVYHDENAEIRLTRKQMKTFFLEEDNAKGQNLQIYVPFGGGRRMCPGTNMSSSLINSSVTAMVQCFDWKVVGGDGPDGSKVNMETKAGVTMSLDKPFMCTPVLHRDVFSA
ncbi:CYTOCHROME P450 FAMILY 705 SUBFAMILY A POLYPEPTIDE 25-RELATED [Salix koriyanagi]|uniref:CYTOCHROME P450 FAMILY 705 SUBFAMILY A POLYPEPTIDE 25-RELATED n=1 Tax=Salix koriyanagi TaxID=2511006 RepID=A0A9Q0TR26_9ROSI|nr:CYTOCHROME P450 FAMILY 705 SUBFAMILY A POLYPEPTIDE 25-RELATED [Salix koriyanagi]